MNNDSDITSWTKEVEKILALLGNEEVIESCSLPEEDMNFSFEPGFGFPQNKPFIAWTKNYVIFSFCYDGRESVKYLPRNPQIVNSITKHVGEE